MTEIVYVAELGPRSARRVAGFSPAEDFVSERRYLLSQARRGDLRPGDERIEPVPRFERRSDRGTQGLGGRRQARQSGKPPVGMRLGSRPFEHLREANRQIIAKAVHEEQGILLPPIPSGTS